MLLRFSHPGHRSPFNIFIFTSYCASGRDNSTRRTPPGRDFDLRNCGVLLKFIFACRLTNFLSLQNLHQRTQWRWRDLNPRPSPCKGAALPLSYIPRIPGLGSVGLTGFEPVTPALSAQCSNQLSYKPAIFFNN